MYLHLPLERMPEYLEDFRVGDTDVYGNYTLTETEIVQFGRRYDPQDIHTDPEAAKQSVYEGLIASGWQTVCLAMRLAVERGYLHDAAVVAGIGVENLRWTNPVRPGDTLRVREEIVETRPSESDPDRGVLKVDIRVFNQHDETVLNMIWIDVVYRADGNEDDGE